VGDKIEAVLVVKRGQGFQLLERITRLPRETKLRFGKARHSAGMSSPAVHISQENQP